MKQYNAMINGEVCAATKYADVINPATGQPFAQVAVGTPSDVDRAVAAAAEAFKSWSQTSDAERRGLIHQLASLVEDNMPELMELVTKESGKPMGGLNGVGSGMEVGGSMAWLRVTADLELPVDVIQDDDAARVEVHRKPLGVVGSITPWNWPLMIAVWHIAPALRAGNTVVIKPSPFTPVATLRFVELANSILPPGVLNIVSGGPEMGAAITNHPGIAKIAFTGSTATGKDIMRSAAGNLKRLTLELSGNDAGIVLDDVDVKAIAPKLVGACFHNNGQTCAALKRLYVPESIYEALAREMASVACQLRVGDGLEEGSDLGPVQNGRQLQIVEDLAESARAEGGRFLCGGQKMDRPGYFFEPTLVADLSNGNRLVDEEPFGPIVPIIKYRNIDEAIGLANDSPTGLGASVWAKDIDRALHVGKQIESGSLWVNDHGAIQPDAPFGGIKDSGFGVEFGRYGLEEFTHIQTVKVVK